MKAIARTPFDHEHGCRNGLVFGTATHFEPMLFIVFKQYMIGFELNLGNFGQVSTASDGLDE